jgi:hypothetical protein
MARLDARRTAPSLESLESRNMQSALSVGANVSGMGAAGPTTAVVTSFQAPGVNAPNTYHSVGGFFGQ